MKKVYAENFAIFILFAQKNNNVEVPSHNKFTAISDVLP